MIHDLRKKTKGINIHKSCLLSPKSERGFTLIELLIVIAIIGILTTLLMVNFIGIRQRARDAERKSDLRQIQAALELYHADTGTYPSTLPVCGSTFSSNGVTYMQKIPCDPLNSGDFRYTYTYNGSTYNLKSCLENVNDSQKDTTDDTAYCASGSTTDWSYTVTNP